MKRFLKRAGALVLSLILPLGGANLAMVLPAMAARKADNLDPAAARSYAEVLQDIEDQYTVCTAPAESDGFVYPYGYWGESVPDTYFGLAYADLIDFDDNGTLELYLYYVKRSDDNHVTDCVVQAELWYWNGSAAEKAYEQEIHSFTMSKSGTQRYYLHQTGGQTYLAEWSYYLNMGFAHRTQDIRLFNGRQTVNYQSIDESWEYWDYIYGYDLEINDEVIYSGENIMGPGAGGEEDYLTPEAEAFYRQHSLKAQNELIYVEEFEYPHWKTNDTSSLLSQLQIRSISGVTGAGALNQVAYAGDRSKCRMDAQMANAYADVIAGMPETVITQWGARGALYVTLADFADDGLPILITAYLNKSNLEDCFTHVNYGDMAGDFIFWGYKNGSAYNGDVDVFGYGNGYGKGFVYAEYYAQDWSVAYDGRYYKISQGQIDLIHTLTFYTVFDNGGRAYGDVPPGASYILESGGADVSKLSENGWVKGAWDSWRLVTDSTGKNVTQQCLNSAGELDLSDLGFDTGNATEVIHFDDIECHINFENTAASVAVSALRAYAGNQSAYPEFTKVTEDGDPYARDVANAVTEALGGEVSGIIKLTGGVYYVVVAIDGAEQGALVRGVRKNGKIFWEAGRKDASPTSPEDLNRLTAWLLTQSNMDLDFSRIPGLSSVQAILNYLQDRLDNMDGVSPNDAAKNDLAAFIETSITGMCTGSVSGTDNRLTVGASIPGGLVSQARSAWKEIESLLDRNNVTLNKDIVIVVRILWHDLSWSEPCRLTLDPSLSDALNGGSVRLLLGDGRHYVQLSAEPLKALVDRYGSLDVQLSKTCENTYSVNFLDSEGGIIDKLPAAVTIGLPADSLTATIMASCTGGRDNWGGRYDPSSGIISFDVRCSGQYEVLENGPQIDDIGELSEDSRTAIRFLVSKGFLSLDGSSFDPFGSLTRYQLAQALVGMSFSLDRSLSTSFEDVPVGSKYYPYVASAEARSIVEGRSETAFGGEDNITVEQMLALAARTLRDRKGYSFPIEPEQYLNCFGDWEDISDWALPPVALTVRENLADWNGMLTPQADISREQAAIILYRLFLLLYEVPPVTLDLPPVAETEPASGSFSAVIAAAAGGAAVLGGGACAAWYFLVKRKTIIIK